MKVKFNYKMFILKIISITFSVIIRKSGQIITKIGIFLRVGILLRSYLKLALKWDHLKKLGNVSTYLLLYLSRVEDDEISFNFAK